MVRLINRLFCRIGLHDRYFVENSRTGVLEEHCYQCPYTVPLYRRRDW